VIVEIRKVYNHWNLLGQKIHGSGWA